MSIPAYMRDGWQYQSPENFDSYLPQLDDYDSQEEYAQALKDSAVDTSAPYGQYYDPIAGVMRGGRRTEQEIALAKYDPAKFLDPNNSFNKGPYTLMRLNNMAAFQPDEARLAYMAHDEFGNQLMDPALAAYMEGQLGIGPYEPPPGEEQPPPAPPVNTGFIDTGKGYWQNQAGHSAYLDPETGEWSFYVLGQDLKTWVPMTPEQYQSFWDNSPYGGGTGQGAPIIGQGDPTHDSGFMDDYRNPPPAVPLPTNERDRPPLGGPNDAPPEGVGARPMSNESTIDPRYPDWLLARRRGSKFGPRPTDSLGGY